jgi:hypothetical protein
MLNQVRSPYFECSVRNVGSAAGGGGAALLAASAAALLAAPSFECPLPPRTS